MPNTTVAPATFNTTNTLGVDVSTNYKTPASAASFSSLTYPQSDTANPPYAPGQIVMAGNAAIYTFAQVSSVGSIVKGDFVAFLASIASTYTVQQITSALAALGPKVGATQFAQDVSTSALTNWCWILTSGNGIGNFVASLIATPGVPLFVSSVAGQLTSVSTSTFLVAGVTNETSTATTSGPVNLNIIANPMMIAQPTSASGTGFVGPF